MPAGWGGLRRKTLFENSCARTVFRLTTIHRVKRRTKIIATIGPACDDEKTMLGLIDAGMDVARINMSHGTIEEGLARFHLIRRLAKQAGRHVGILVDLPGPKVRCASFGDDPVRLKVGTTVKLEVGNDKSTADTIEVNYEGLVSDIQVGDTLNMGDGRAIFEVTEKQPEHLVATIIHGGKVSGRPGLHVPSDRLRMSTPTDEDLVILDAFVEVGVDMVALSFVRSAHEVRRVGTEPHPRGPLVIAKVETRAAVENLEGIIEASGAVMVARGDLGNELPIEDLPSVQKEIISKCIALGRPAITATQMLESMIDSPAPTRAEASDVANAVWDGSSAVMLSGETAVGADPINTLRTMGRIARRADEDFDHERWARRIAQLRMTGGADPNAAVTDAMTMAAWRATSELKVKTIVAVSGSGFTVRSMSRFRPAARILGFSANPRTVDQLTLSWGTTPINLSGQSTSNEEMAAEAVKIAKELGHVSTGELVAVLAGATTSSQSANVLRLVTVE